MPQVFLLKPGFIQRDESGNILDARSSVTIILAESRKIVVDTGQNGEAEQILEGLARLNLQPEDIDAIVNTHSHPDHCANNNLFYRAEFLTPIDGQMIAPGVLSMETPGHSFDSISVVVDADVLGVDQGMIFSTERAMVVVMAGDALPTFGNFQKNVPPALHIDRNQAISSMAKIIALADVVIPGHDYPFSITNEEYIFHSVQTGRS